MAIREFKMPDIGEGVAEGEIVSWKVAVGDQVEEEQDFVEVMTDKATVTITSPVTGTVAELCFNEGDVVPVETVIAKFEVGGEGGGAQEQPEAGAQEERAEQSEKDDEADEADEREKETERAKAEKQDEAAKSEQRESAAKDGGEKKTSAPSSPGKVLAAPATRKLAREQGIDLTEVEGSGRGGRVTREDVEKFLESGAKPRADEKREAGEERDAETTGGPLQPSRKPVSIAKPSSPELEERLPFRGVRKKTAEAMARSKFTATHFSIVEDMDVTELVQLRSAVKERYAGEVKITYMPFIMKAVVAGLREYPWLNSALDESTQEIVLKKYYHLGIATDTPNGLIVPVIRDVDRKSILTLATELQELAQRTREGGVKGEELQGGTFSITNAGNLGGLFATPIINFPEVAILGVHKIQAQPRVVDGEIRVRDIMYCSVSIDHRIVDGADGVRFLNVVKRCLENPQQLLLEM